LNLFYDLFNQPCGCAFRKNPSTVNEIIILNFENPIFNDDLAVYEIAFSPDSEIQKNLLTLERFSFYYIQNVSPPFFFYTSLFFITLFKLDDGKNEKTVE